MSLSTLNNSILYSNLKAFYFKEKLDSLLGDKILPPIHVRIKPTNVCNHRCWYCAYRSKGLQLGQDMVETDFIPREKMLEIIDDLNEMNVKAVTFSGGGDPFCYPYLLDATKKLSKTPIKFAALTNGGRLQGYTAFIFAYYATWLRVSMDGWDDKSYSRLRNVGDKEFTKIIKNMESFQKLGGKCYLSVSVVVQRDNATHIYDLVQTLKNAGVKGVKLSPCVISNDGLENDKYHKPFYNEAKEQIQKAITLSDGDFEVVDLYHKMAGDFGKNYHWCPYLQILPIIGADLNVYPCQDKAYNLQDGLVGSIKDMRFKDFWFSNREKFYKIDPSVKCNHHCVAHDKNKLILEYLNLDKEHIEFV